MAEHNARLVNVEDRSVEKGDITISDFAGSFFFFSISSCFVQLRHCAFSS